MALDYFDISSIKSRKNKSLSNTIPPWFNFLIFVSAIVALVVTALFMLALRPVALSIGMIDKPGGHKAHVGEVPVIGGLAMFLGASIGISLVPDLEAHWYYILLAGSVLVVVGLIDDRYTLPASVRLVAQLTAALITMFGGEFVMRDIGDPLWIGVIHTGPLALIVTALMYVTVINAFNLVDGIDGLAGSMALVAVAGIAMIAGPESNTVGTAAVFIGTIVGYLMFNFPIGNARPYRAFMGDAGSTFIGLSVVWLTVSVCQGPDRQISPVTGLWFAAIPIYDLITCFCRRIANGRSPFSSGVDHFHHTLLRAGMTVRQVVATLISLQVLYVSFAISAHYIGVSDSVAFAIWSVTGVSQFAVIKGIAKLFQLRTGVTAV